APLGRFEAICRQRHQRGTVDALEELTPAYTTQAPHRPCVKVLEQLADAGIERLEREERLVAEPRQDPALRHEHPRLDLRLVARLSRPCRNHRRAIVAPKVFVGAL